MTRWTAMSFIFLSLAACTQQELAAVEDRGERFFGRDGREMSAFSDSRYQKHEDGDGYAAVDRRVHQAAPSNSVGVSELAPITQQDMAPPVARPQVAAQGISGQGISGQGISSAPFKAPAPKAVFLEPDPYGAEIKAMRLQESMGAVQPAAADVAQVAPSVAPVAATTGGHVVQPGETLYRISKQYGVSVDGLMRANGIGSPQELRLGQTLVIPGVGAVPAANVVASVKPAPVVAPVVAAAPVVKPVEKVMAEKAVAPAIKEEAVKPTVLASVKPVAKPKVVLAEAPKKVAELAAPVTNVSMKAAEEPVVMNAPKAHSGGFQWPVKGAVLQGYGSQAGGVFNDGINISAPAGTPVKAAADGDVVYAGDQLEGYGNLVIVRHADGWLTAYAHNANVMVKKGQKVKQGDAIAKVGQTGKVKSPQLHFSVRQGQEAKDPLALLSGEAQTAHSL